MALLTGGKTIMCVDDEKAIRRTLVNYFEDCGYTVEQTDNGETALTLIRNLPPDVVLLDLRLPGKDGIEVLEEIKKEFPDIAVIMISGRGEMADVIDALRAGAWDYITKPIADMAVLEHSVQKAMERIDLIRKSREYERDLEKLVLKKAEALKENEEKYRALFYDSKDAYMIFGPQQTFVSANDSTLKLFGLKTEEEFIQKSPAELSPEYQPDGRASSEKSQAMINMALDSGSHFFEWKHRRTDGEEFYATVLLTRMEIRGNVFLQATVRDITEQKLTEEQLRQAQKMEIVGNLAGGLAHDFNNVLGSIMGALSIMNYKLKINQGLKREELEDYIEMMNESGKRASNMVKQLLSLSRKQELTLKSVDLNVIINSVVKICLGTFDKSINLEPHFHDSPAMVKADPTQMEQVLLNLCVNAGHAMTIMKPKGSGWGGVLEITLEKTTVDKYVRESHPTAEARDYWILSVKDNGVGISPDARSRIFNPFFSTKGKDSGTGLGLSMVYNIVKQHNGFLDVYSQMGLGTTFSVYLPVLEGGVVEPEVKKAPENVRKGEGLVLVVDDEKVILLVAGKILEECGYKVITAENGRDAIKEFKRHHKDIRLVLLDLAMPVMSGKEVYIKLKEIDPQVKVLLASGFRRADRVSEVMALGVDGFLQKPFTLEKLSNAIDRIIG